jgi:hypothetical protein
MGHVNHDDLKKMVKEGHVTGIELDMDSKLELCQTCLKAKATCKPFPRHSSRENITEYGSKYLQTSGDQHRSNHWEARNAVYATKTCTPTRRKYIS